MAIAGELELGAPMRDEPGAQAIVRGVCRLLNEMGYATLIEMKLASGRRVDVIGPGGTVPVDPGLAHSRVPRAFDVGPRLVSDIQRLFRLDAHTFAHLMKDRDVRLVRA